MKKRTIIASCFLIWFSGMILSHYVIEYVPVPASVEKLVTK